MRYLVLIPCLALFAATGLQAHHSLTAEYDQSKKVTLHGTLNSIDWRNPHAWIYLTVKEENGSTSKWQCELGSPNAIPAKAGARMPPKPAMSWWWKACSPRTAPKPAAPET